MAYTYVYYIYIYTYIHTYIYIYIYIYIYNCMFVFCREALLEDLEEAINPLALGVLGRGDLTGRSLPSLR